MCGRYTHLFTWEQLHRLSTLTTPEFAIPRSYNVAPTQLAPVIRAIDSARTLDLLKWGLVPFWAKDESIGNSLINARGETVTEKPAFRAAFKARRCLVPVSGFYEWKREGKAKQPYYIRGSDESPLLFAGLWEEWKSHEDPARPPLQTYTIITTAPNEMMSTLHDRMPVIIAPEHQEHWLKAPPAEAAALIRPYPAELMLCYPVSTRVNSPKNNDASCMERVSSLFPPA